jgi:hypothetical protein
MHESSTNMRIILISLLIVEWWQLMKISDLEQELKNAKSELNVVKTRANK